MGKRTWLITGISSGLGKALAEAVIKDGDYVIGTFRKEEQVKEFNKKYSGNATSFLLDVSSEKSIIELVATIKKNHEKIDVLVNNAGIGFIGAIEESSTEETRTIFETNFFGALKMTQEVLPIMREQKSGRIIQISSHSGFKSFMGFGIYSASKFALEGVSEALAAEVAPLGIHVSIIEPGPFRTKFAGESLQEAKTRISDYDNTAGAFRNKLRSVNGVQEGNPHKASDAIIELSKHEHPPLRLPLGKIAVNTLQTKLEQVKKDLQEGKETAESVVY